jgi:MOSC domain-containing protein YiiM
MKPIVRISSINIGKIREFSLAGSIVRTAFFKHPVDQKIEAGPLGLNGDEQADLTVHGGLDKAVYAYPGEHYASWERTLGQGTLAPGSFGENLTTRGLTEGAGVHRRHLRRWKRTPTGDPAAKPLLQTSDSVR